MMMMISLSLPATNAADMLQRRLLSVDEDTEIAYDNHWLTDSPLIELVISSVIFQF